MTLAYNDEDCGATQSSAPSATSTPRDEDMEDERAALAELVATLEEQERMRRKREEAASRATADEARKLADGLAAASTASDASDSARQSRERSTRSTAASSRRPDSVAPKPAAESSKRGDDWLLAQTAEEKRAELLAKEEQIKQLQAALSISKGASAKARAEAPEQRRARRHLLGRMLRQLRLQNEYDDDLPGTGSGKREAATFRTYDQQQKMDQKMSSLPLSCKFQWFVCYIPFASLFFSCFCLFLFVVVYFFELKKYFVLLLLLCLCLFSVSKSSGCTQSGRRECFVSSLASCGSSSAAVVQISTGTLS